jgi:plastocyanin
MRRTFVISATLIAAAMLAVPAQAGAGTFIDVDEYSYSPAAKTAPTYHSTYFLSFENVGSFPHTATQDAGMFDTDTIGSGMSEQIGLQGAGAYPYHCEVHPTQMHGTFRLRPVASATSVSTGQAFTLRVGPDVVVKGYEFDVQRRRNGGAWVLVRDGIFNGTPSFTLSRTGTFDFRARTLFSNTPVKSGWSPIRTVTAIAAGENLSNRIARFTSWIAFVTSMPRGHASVQLKVVRHRNTPVFSERIFRRSRPASSRVSKMNRCAFTMAAGPTYSSSPQKTGHDVVQQAQRMHLVVSS